MNSSECTLCTDTKKLKRKEYDNSQVAAKKQKRKEYDKRRREDPKVKAYYRERQRLYRLRRKARDPQWAEAEKNKLLIRYHTDLEFRKSRLAYARSYRLRTCEKSAETGANRELTKAKINDLYAWDVV